MSETPNPATPTFKAPPKQAEPDAQTAQPPVAPKPTPPPVHEDDKTDWVAEAKKWEKRAKENVEKARRLDELEEANKTEAQRMAEALTAAQREAESAKVDALRFRVAAKHNISDADAESFLTGSDPDTLERQAARLAEMLAQSQPPAGYVRGEGTRPTPPALNSNGLEDAIKSKLGIA